MKNIRLNTRVHDNFRNCKAIYGTLHCTVESNVRHCSFECSSVFSCSCVAPSAVYDRFKRTCVTRKACLAEPSLCSGPGRQCNDGPDGTYYCSCETGYKPTDANVSACALNDYCAEMNVNCAPGSCTNVLGGFQCDCPNGYRPTNDSCVSSINQSPVTQTPEESSCAH